MNKRFELVVNSHVTREIKDKLPRFKVVMRSHPTAPTKVTMSLRSELRSVFENFPLNESFSVVITTEQTRLEIGEKDE